MKKLPPIVLILLPLLTSAQLIKQDKIKHITVSATLTVVSMQMFKDRPLIAVSSVLMIGLGKELVYDKMLDRGCCEVSDMAANVVGVIGGYVLSRLVCKWLNPVSGRKDEVSKVVKESYL